MSDASQIVERAVVVTGAVIDPKQASTRLALFHEDGTPVVLGDGTDDQTGAQVLLTGYAPHAVGNVVAADTANVAIAKLEARIAALEAA